MQEENIIRLEQAINDAEKANEEARLQAEEAGAFLCMARHRDAGSTFWIGSGAIKFEASEKALAKCKRWARRKGKRSRLMPHPALSEPFLKKP